MKSNSKGANTMKKPSTSSRPSLYQTVTDRIITSLKAGVIPWEKPWKSPRFAGGPFSRNFYTGKPYRGINVLLLWSSDYSSPFWLTFKQAQELKGTVRKGEHGTPIVFYKQLPEYAKNDSEGSGEDERAPFVLCRYTVFNVEQCDGLTLPEISQPAIAPDVDEDELCESIVTGWENRPALHLDSPTEYRAYYRPSTDSVHMPARNRFVDTAHYYSTLFHELIHSTGHESRLNRTFGDRFGDELYSKEELVAEMGAAFLCAIAGIANEHTDRNTTAYIQNWISKLEEDNRLIVHAAANAQKAVDSILGSTFEEESETTENAGDAAPAASPHLSSRHRRTSFYRHKTEARRRVARLCPTSCRSGGRPRERALLSPFGRAAPSRQTIVRVCHLGAPTTPASHHRRTRSLPVSLAFDFVGCAL
jgi:antirestriction protein ArdC